MKKNFKERFQEKFENYLKASKKQRHKRALEQIEMKEELREENINLDRRGKFKKIFKFFLIIVLYNIFRMLTRYKTGREFIEPTDFVFSIILIAMYAIYIINYKKNQNKKERQEFQTNKK